jgi:hypothetical protein
MRGPELIAAAILVGCGMIAVAHYLGLRAGPAEGSAPVSGVAPAATGSATSPGVLPPDALPVGSPAPEDPAVASATEALRRALAEAKPTLKKTCWDPALAKEPLPDRASYIYSVGFDPEGHIQRLEVHLQRSAPRLDVVACLQAHPVKLTLPPPGRPLNAQVPLDFP